MKMCSTATVRFENLFCPPAAAALFFCGFNIWFFKIEKEKVKTWLIKNVKNKMMGNIFKIGGTKFNLGLNYDTADG